MNNQELIFDPIWAILARYEQFGDKLALATRNGEKWDEVTYCQLAERIKNFAHFLIDEGLAPGKRISYLSESSHHVVICFLGSLLAGNTVVPIDNKLTSFEINNILEHAEVDVVFLESEFQSTLEEASIGLTKKLLKLPIDKIYTGKKPEVYPTLPVHVAAIINYTSGTTGKPKGVMLSIMNLFSQLAALRNTIPLNNGRFLSILPLNHMFEITAGVYYPLYFGETVYFARTILPLQLLEIMRTKKITHMNTIPLVLDAFKGGMERKIASLPKFKKSLVNLFLKLSILMPQVFRKKVFKEFHRALGGSFNLFFTGGAPLRDSSFEFFRRIGIPVIQGYGLTETSPICIMNSMDDPVKGSIGFPINNVKVRFEKKDELDKFGVLQVKGPNVMLGYYKNEELTDKVINADGWFDTGDIGYRDSKGRIFLTGREKNLIVLGGGKKVHPEEVEVIIEECPFVKETVVTRYKEKNIRGVENESVGCILVPVDNYLNDFNSKEDAEKALLQSIEEYRTRLSSYKWPSKFHIQYNDFIRTTTKKINRSNISIPLQ